MLFLRFYLFFVRKGKFIVYLFTTQITCKLPPTSASLVLSDPGLF